MSDPLLSVEDLEKHYYEQDTLVDTLLGRETRAVRAVDGVSFEVREGETLGLVGESGCGKSTTGETVLRLREATGGTVRFDGEPLEERDDLTEFRRRAGIVFQDPFSSLDPRMTAGQIIREPLDVHGVGSKADREERVTELLDRVGLSADQRDRYPHEFSGGQQQRIGVARALALEPDFLVLDEPVSALDVSVQAQILNLLADLQDDLGLTYLFIAHDLSVVRHICDRVAVMYLGELVETGPTDRIFEDPRHPYTEALLESVPRADVGERDREIEPLTGDVPSPRDPPSGCRFHTRCPKVIPPEDIDLEQRAYREVMSYRQRVEERAIPLESVWEDAAERADGDAGSPEGDGADDEEYPAPPSAFRDVLWAQFFDSREGLTARDETEIEESFDLLADEQWDAAAGRLRERYESVCEREHPPDFDVGEGRSACHLVGDDARDAGERVEGVGSD